MAYDMHHDDGFQEIQLSGKQLVFLFMATTVVSIVIFLFGVLVGRGAPLERIAGTTAGGALAAPMDDLAAAPRSGQPTSEEGLTYPARLSEPVASSERVAPPPVPAASPAAAASPVEAPPAPAKAASTRPEAAKATAPVVPEEAAPSAGDGGFTVQVTALKSKADADAIAQRLQGKGYPAYVVAPGSGGQVIYKVRVGMNMERPQADQLMRRLQTEEKFKPWVTR
jgi:cell division septation protein DedD